MFKQVLAASALLAISATSVVAEDDPLANPEDKLSYSLGLLIGNSLKNDYDSLNFEVLSDGLKAQHGGGDTLLSLDEASTFVQGYMQQLAQTKSAESRMKGQQYLADNALRKEVETTESGLQYEVLKAAEGPKPTATDTVRVHYHGTLIDGTVFDSSVDRAEPISFPLNRVIPGWTEGVQLMSVGSKYRFVIPSQLAYGERGAGQNIGPGETLIFEVELLEINPEES